MRVADTKGVSSAVLDVVAALCGMSEKPAQTISDGALAADLGQSVGTNLGGDGQKALDLIANTAFANALKDTMVRWYASEERDEVAEQNPKGSLALAIDPLDGSSHIDVNVSIGMIFSIFDAVDDPLKSFLRPAREQIAAGYFIFGPSCGLVVTFGAGTLHFTMDSRTR